MRRFFGNNNNGYSNNANNVAVASNNPDFHQQAQSLIPAEVRMISGCHSEQTSADVSNVGSVAQLPNPAGRAGGACTSALLDILYRHHRYHQQPLYFQDLLLQLRDALAQTGMSQVPQLTSSRPLELQKTPFSLVAGPHGRRRALLVGINYRGQNGELSGCHNDVYNVKKYIMERHGFPESDILMLLDDSGRHVYPTRNKIIAALRALVQQSVAGDSIYFHYSGHGGLLHPEWNTFRQNNGGYDETIYPVDHAKSGQIRDFSLFNHFVKPLATGVVATCVMDCCHSGSVLDLPYTFRPTEGGGRGIVMRENMDTLSNLAFLYVLAGGILPHGFGTVTQHIEDNVDGELDNYQGTAVEEMQEVDMADDDDYYPEGGDMGGDVGDMGDVGGGEDYYNVDDGQDRDFGATADDTYAPDVEDSAPPVVEGFTVPQEGVYEDYGGGGFGTYGDYGGAAYEDVDTDGGGDDCACFSSLLGALMEDE